MKWEQRELLPKIYCHVCGKIVTIDADRGRHSYDFTKGGSRRYRFFCATCANSCYKAAIKRGHIIQGWTLAPRWFGNACVTLRRRAERVK